VSQYSHISCPNISKYLTSLNRLTLTLAMLIIYQLSSRHLNTSIVARVYHIIRNWNMKNIFNTVGKVIKMQLYQTQGNDSYCRNCQQMSEIAFSVVSSSKNFFNPLDLSSGFKKIQNLVVLIKTGISTLGKTTFIVILCQIS